MIDILTTMLDAFKDVLKLFRNKIIYQVTSIIVEEVDIKDNVKNRLIKKIKEVEKK